LGLLTLGEDGKCFTYFNFSFTQWMWQLWKYIIWPVE
jgi:hypothetical protein